MKMGRTGGQRSGSSATLPRPLQNKERIPPAAGNAASPPESRPQVKKASSLKVMLAARALLSTPSDWSDMVKGPGFLD